MGTHNILECMVEYNTKLIFASSSSVYGIKKITNNRKNPTNPLNHGLTKLTTKNK